MAFVAAVPAVASAAGTGAAAGAAGGAAGAGAGAAGGGTAAAAGGRAAAGAAPKGGGGGAGKTAGEIAGALGGGKKKGSPSKGDQAKSWGKKGLSGGGAARYRRWLVAEFIVCVILLGLAPLAKPDNEELGPVRWMKRGSATCALFIVLGILSSFGKGAAKAAGMFGFLVTLVLLVDQREAFGRLAKMLNTPEADDNEMPESGNVGPPSAPWEEGGGMPSVIQT